ncbi:peptidoglycan DD-metalloendopeptidase family protein [Zavarzinia sp. CC-PAN008]|uniref:peptidoglycan DD-metalloendopeptidase family protein n=1 Tax=Zavarzinia sp. CC-PAN008 TaxID=3243332 RepID=UPI003F7457CA
MSSALTLRVAAARLAVCAGLVLGVAACTYDASRHPPTTTVSSGVGEGAPSAGPRPGPAGGEVVVQPGDSLSRIAARLDIPLSALMAANSEIAPPYRIFPGQRIRLPGAAPVPVPVVAQSGPVAAPVVARPSMPAPSIAATPLAPPTRLGAPLAPMPAQQASARPPPVLEPGDLPGPGEDVPPLAGPAGVGATLAALPVPRARPTPPEGTPEGGTSAAAGLPATPPRSATTFLWPVQGPIISAFGPKPDGLHNDGINIKADAGTPVKAAEAGVVVYAGNELRGFGNLILIRHEGGWVTAYGHNERLLVARGDVVSRGQAIARVGRTGTVTTPQLHFEIRKGRETVDPTKYLAS